MFEILMVLGFAYAGFCFLLPERAAEEAEEEGDARRRRDPPAHPDRRRPEPTPWKRKRGVLFRYGTVPGRSAPR